MKIETIKSTVFQTVFFGKYSLPTGIKPNSIVWVEKPIEWLQISSNTNGRALLLSKYCLDWDGYQYDGTVCWEESDAREYLNNTFFDQAFSEEEKRHIVAAEIYSDKDIITYDYVFLLSMNEIEKYLKNVNDRVALMPFIDYLYTQDISKEINKYQMTMDPYPWWTRTSDQNTSTTKIINEFGDAMDIHSSADEVGIRPAIWIRIDE